MNKKRKKRFFTSMTLETCPSARRMLVILHQTGVGISRKEPQNWGVLGSRPFGLGCVYRHILLPRVLPPRLWPLLVRAYDMENRRKKNWAFRAALFKVTQRHRNGWGSIRYPWLPINLPRAYLAPFSSEISTTGRKLRMFLNPRLFHPSAEAFPLELYNVRRLGSKTVDWLDYLTEKTLMIGYLWPFGCNTRM